MHCRALHSGGALIKGNSGWDNDVVNDDDKDVEDDDDNRGLIKAGAEWWVRLWWQLLSQEQISSLLPPLITEAALIINNCIALITETWTHNGTIVQPLSLITPVPSLYPISTPFFACYTCPPLSLHQLVKHSAGHSSTCSNGRSFLLSIGFHPRSSFLGPFIRHSLGSYHWSSFLVPNLEPVLCLSHLSHPLSLDQLLKHSAGQHVQMVAAFCF